MDEETEPHRSRVAQEPMVVMSRAWDAGSSSFHPAAEGRGSQGDQVGGLTSQVGG